MTVKEHASQLKNQVKDPFKKTVIADDKRKVCFIKQITVEITFPFQRMISNSSFLARAIGDEWMVGLRYLVGSFPTLVFCCRSTVVHSTI